MQQTCPAAGQLVHRLGHRDIELQRRVGIDDREQCRFLEQSRAIDLQRDAGHLYRVPRAQAAQGIGLAVLVGQLVLRKIQVEVTRLGGQVHRLERAAAFLVNDVQALHEAQVIAHLLRRYPVAAPYRGR